MAIVHHRTWYFVDPRRRDHLIDICIARRTIRAAVPFAREILGGGSERSSRFDVLDHYQRMCECL